ncbi:MAG: hypothetical protein D6813_12920 [Calditrichaeota bacterium]|nr:MAG: hypothetical protein D6813_12920 [Calditrichota bacterium]
MEKLYATILLTLLLFVTALLGQNAYGVYINEIRANDNVVDNIELVELIGPAGTDLSGFKIEHRNGNADNDGPVWTHTISSFVIPDDGVTDNQGTALGFYVVAQQNSSVPNTDATLPGLLQNGPDDGLILYDDLGNIIDAVAWGGEGDLTVDDPGTVTTIGSPSANNYLHITINDDESDNSLQAPNNVVDDDGSGWKLDAATPGAINFNQTGGDLSLPVTLSSFTAIAGNGQITLRWVTESETGNLGFVLCRNTERDGEYSLISSYESNPALQGQYNFSNRHVYTFTDRMVVNGVTYWYKLADVDVNGRYTYHQPVHATPQATDSEIITTGDNLPADFYLYPNYPNPFNPNTTIKFYIPAGEDEASPVSLVVFNVLGEQVKTLYQGTRAPGQYEVRWDGLDEFGRVVPGGVYYALLKMNELQRTIKMVFLK